MNALATQSAASPEVRQAGHGQDHRAADGIDQSIAILTAWLEAAVRDPINRPAGRIAEVHAQLGNAYMLRGHTLLAAHSYRSALKLVPHLTSCWCGLGDLSLRAGRPTDAIPLYLRALEFDPDHWRSRTNLVEALMATGQFETARALLQGLLEEQPQDSQLLHQLGRVYFELNEMETAIRHFEQAIVLNPNDADSRYWIGGIRQRMGDADAARAAYVEATQIRPLIRKRAIKSPPDFRLLAIYAPLSGNTPTPYLFRDATYDIDTLALFDAIESDISAVEDIDVIVNLVSDADQSVAMLSASASLAERLAKPIVNDPARILCTTRDKVADLLSDVPGCRVPRILRLDPGTNVSTTAIAELRPFSFPVLVRPAGTHGGDAFEKVENIDELAYRLEQHWDAAHYLIEYVDYASRDGHFRKYRFFFVGELILPYHLAIGSHWKVHHLSTDMAHWPWMQQEEAAFLANPGAVFNAAHYNALRTVRDRIRLDYFGIDCGLDRDGTLIVFEANASMLVHDDNAQFPYKEPFVRDIKNAFNAVLRNRAGCDLAERSALLRP